MMRQWNLTSLQVPGPEVRLFPPDTRFLQGMAFTRDGRYVATANPNGTV